MAGDFNATLDHPELRRLLTRGWRDAGRERGEALEPTWHGLPLAASRSTRARTARAAVLGYEVADLAAATTARSRSPSACRPADGAAPRTVRLRGGQRPSGRSAATSARTSSTAIRRGGFGARTGEHEEEARGRSAVDRAAHEAGMAERLGEAGDQATPHPRRRVPPRHPLLAVVAHIGAKPRDRAHGGRDHRAGILRLGRHPRSSARCSSRRPIAGPPAGSRAGDPPGARCRAGR